MTSFALSFLFIFQLVLAVAGLLAWWRLKDRMAALEAKAAEALDDQDLMEFQERVSSLLGQVKEAGKDMVALIDARRAGLDSQAARAREAEKRLAEKIKGFERVEEKTRKRLDEWVSLQNKPGRKQAKSKAKAREKAAPPAAQPEQAPSPAPAAEAPGQNALKVSYLKRDFRPPEPQAPQNSTASRYLKVYALADEGRSREEIAKACGYLPGEVELILNLRPRPRG